MSEQGVPVETEDAGFESGFNDVPPVTTVTNEPQPQSQPASEPKAEQTKVEPTKTEAEPKAEAPTFAQITIEELEGLKSAASKTAENKKQLDTLLGTIGRVQQYLKKLDETAVSGVAIDLPADALADMREDYPELAAKLEAIFGKARVRGSARYEEPAEVTPAKPAEADQRAVSTLIREAMRESAKETLEDAYPDWREIVGAVAEGQSPNPEHPFRKWLASKDEAYQHRINATESPGVIARAIERFQSETAKPETKAAQKPAPNEAAREQRTARIASAIQPKGDGKPPTLPKSADDEEDAFEKGFKSG